MSIASEISRLLQAKADIKIAIEGKGVTVSGTATLDDYSDLIDAIQQGSEPNLQSKSVSITQNGTTTVEPDTGYDGLSDVEVAVNVQGGGGGGTSTGDDVRFIDYDGTVLHSYSADDFLALSAMPENPSHDGLTAQGWNWSLADAKAQVQSSGTCDIGQMYITDDGKTRIYVKLYEGNLSPYLGICPNGTVEVDWGDGKSTNTLTGTSLTTRRTAQHTYDNPGNYVITLTVTAGTFAFYGTSSNAYILTENTSNTSGASYVYSHNIEKVLIGSNALISNYAFHFCRNLNTITIPDGITSLGTSAFSHCSSLLSLIIPDGVSSIEQSFAYYGFDLETIAIPNSITSIGNSSFNTCYSLKRITIPDGVTSIGNTAFQNCVCLSSITIPDSVTSVGNNAFQTCSGLATAKLSNRATSVPQNIFNGCSNLQSITVPDGVTSIGNSAFSGCFNLKTATIPDSVTSIGTYVFNNCNLLSSVEIPDGVTSIGNYDFYQCYCLKSITIPDSVTSIGSYAFSNCVYFSSVTIPAGVTSIGNYAFGGCYGVTEYHVLSTTPPTLGGSSVFSNIKSNCKIYVPAESLEAYQTAQYWSSHKSKMVGV